jgi:AcrR family transcriptional regulator
MAGPTRRKAAARGYHHGDLERALVDTALRVIQEEGLDALTLRGVGARLGVSRTALYRHFDDKEALLARVASEGFKRFHDALAKAAADGEKRDNDPMPAMAAAYARFARSHPAHYQTMFSGVLAGATCDPELQQHGEAAFNVLLDAIRRGQARGRVRSGDPLELAETTWALSHGIATLAMAKLLPSSSKVDELAVRAWTLLDEGLGRK